MRNLVTRDSNWGTKPDELTCRTLEHSTVGILLNSWPELYVWAVVGKEWVTEQVGGTRVCTPE